MVEKQKSMQLIDEQSKMSIERLQKIIDETQETVRAYDIKAEILAIILTLVIGIINFTLVNNFNSVVSIKYTALITTALGVIALFVDGLVLYPKKDVFKAIQTNNYKPKRTYFVNMETTPTFNNIDIYVDEIDSTDWKHELAYEVLKISLIRDRKHQCFVWALRLSGLTFLGIIILIVEISMYG
jgi:hypothetical protein